MIGELDDQLAEWVAEVLPGARVSLDGPAGGERGADVGLHLLELGDLPAARGERRPPLQVRLSYLVTTAGDDAREAHERLGQLLFAAMAREDFEVGFPQIPPAFWAAADVPPRPSFTMTVPLRRDVEERRAVPVREPLVVQGTAVGPLTGVVLGPGDVPIVDAFIEIPALLLSTRTDGRGRFRFPAVPAGAAKQQLRVRAKSSEFPFSIDSADRHAAVALRINPLKG